MTANEPEVVGPLPTFYVEELVEVQMQDVEVEGSPQCPVYTCGASMALFVFCYHSFTRGLFRFLDSSSYCLQTLSISLTLFVCCSVIIVARNFSFCIVRLVTCKFYLKHNQYRFVGY